MHGYDVIDPTRVNPELGGEDGAAPAGRRAARARSMGLIVDIVPNHMAADAGERLVGRRAAPGPRQPLRALLRHRLGRRRPQGLLPILGKPLVEALAAGEIDAGREELRYSRTPADSADDLRPADARTAALSPGWWRAAGDRINWRRFFDINELVCLRMEDDEVFEAVHAMIAAALCRGPDRRRAGRSRRRPGRSRGYCRKLRQRLDPKNPAGPYLVVEKILLRGETLPADWGCDGTTGYDFMDEVSALQHDPAGEPALAEAWAALSGRPADFAPEEAGGAARDPRPQLLGPARSLRRAPSTALEQSDLNRPALAPRAHRAAGAFPGLSHLRHRRGLTRRWPAERAAEGARSDRASPATAGLIDLARSAGCWSRTGNAHGIGASSS